MINSSMNITGKKPKNITKSVVVNGMLNLGNINAQEREMTKTCPGMFHLNRMLSTNYYTYKLVTCFTLGNYGAIQFSKRPLVFISANDISAISSRPLNLYFYIF